MHVLLVVAWITAHQCSVAGAIGITANLWVESHDLRDYTKLDPKSDASGIGVAQWVGSRRARMLRELGSRWPDAIAQLEFLKKEAEERGDWQATCRQPITLLATTTWQYRFEGGRGRDYRIRIAGWLEQAYNQSGAAR